MMPIRRLLLISCLPVLLSSNYSFANALERCVQDLAQLDRNTITDPWNQLTRERLVELYASGQADQSFGRNVRAVYVPELDTLQLENAAGRFPKGAKAILVALHGWGTIRSHPEVKKPIISIAGDPTLSNKNKKGARYQVMKLDNYVPLAVIAPSLPFTTHGPNSKNFKTADDTAQFLLKYLRWLRSQRPDLPLLVLGRSASPQFAHLVRMADPDLIDLSVYMSAAMPGTEEFLERQDQAFKEVAAKENFVIKKDTLDYLRKVMSTFQMEEKGYQKNRTLFLYGTEDGEIMEEERETARAMAMKYPDLVTYHNIVGAGHDVFNIYENKQIGISSYQLLYGEIRKVLQAREKH